MIRTQVYIPDELYAEAKRYAALHDMNISQLIRAGLAKELKATLPGAKKNTKKGAAKHDPLADLVGKYSFGNGPTNAALTHNDIYDN